MANALAYGFVGLQHLFSDRLETVSTTVITNAILRSQQEYNRQVTALLSSMVTRTTEYMRRYTIPGGGTLQPLDEYGVPRPVQVGGHYDVAWPIQGGGTAFGDNRVTRALQTVGELNRVTVEAQKRDADWMRRHMLAALFDNVAWVFADPDHGNLTVQPLANGDAVVYQKKAGAAAVDTHYLAQAAAIADATNPYTAIYAELDEHPGNNGPKVAYIPTALVATTEALTTFVPVADPNIALGSASDRLVGTIDPGFGDKLIGRVSNVWIVKWSILPSDIILAVDRAATDTLAMREYPAASLQGLFAENSSPDGNLKQTSLIRYAGFGSLNRTGAVVYRVGDAAYAIPTGYGAPLAV